ncbi:MAG: hypothetical protein SPK48_08260 [Bullifex sp.]|nr:hypothetical protein [Spirochaetales bacterium]MDY5777821.1 hypothetical protein [Bullifex sp.]
MKQFKQIMTVLLVLLLLTSCSSVFSGGFTGTIREDKGGSDDSNNTGIEGATVYIYTDEGARNADYDAATAASPSLPSRYVASTTTNANGQFSVSKILWQTNSPAYGKTADRISLYLLIHKAGFGVNGYNKNSSMITIASDSTNEATYTEAFRRTEKVTTVSFTLSNIVSGGAAVSDPLLIKLSDLKVLDDSCTITRTSSDNTFDVAYKNDDSAAPRIMVNGYTIQNEKGSSTWKLCAEDGSAFVPIERNIYTSQGTQNISLYAKQTEFTFPNVSGRAADTDSGNDRGSSAADGLQVTLYISDGAGSPVATLGTSVTQPQQLAQDRVTHGNFTVSADPNIKWYSSGYDGLYAPYSGNDEAYKLMLKVGNIIKDITADYSSKDTQLNMGDITI